MISSCLICGHYPNHGECTGPQLVHTHYSDLIFASNLSVLMNRKYISITSLHVADDEAPRHGDVFINPSGLDETVPAGGT
jgi:hypothetical protein